MWYSARRAALYFLAGFVVAFLIYLFVRFEADRVLLGVAIGAVAGILFAALVLWLERRYPEPTDTRPR